MHYKMKSRDQFAVVVILLLLGNSLCQEVGLRQQQYCRQRYGRCCDTKVINGIGACSRSGNYKMCGLIGGRCKCWSRNNPG